MNPKSKRFLFFFCLFSLLFLFEPQQKEMLAQDGEGHIVYLPIVSKAPGTLAFAVYKIESIGANIFTINADGTNLKQLTDTPYGNYPFDWSPDGQKIVFQSSRDRHPYNSPEIYTMNADGSDQKNITNARGSDYDPAWSPDGSKIAFVSNRNELPWQLYIMNPDGSNVTHLTWTDFSCFLPVWSPDGKKIAFFCGSSYNGAEIYIYDLIAQKRVQVTFNTFHDEPLGWSPDSTKLLYLSNIKTGGEESNYDIFVMELAGTQEIHQLTDGGNGFHAAYSPDGSQIIFTGYLEGEYGAYFARADNYSITSFVCSNEFHGYPFVRQQWSPDGKSIAFSIGGPDPGIGIMELSDRTCKRIVSISTIYDLQWKPKP